MILCFITYNIFLYRTGFVQKTSQNIDYISIQPNARIILTVIM